MKTKKKEKRQKEKKKKKFKTLRYIGYLLYIAVFLGVTTPLVLFFGPYENTRKAFWLIKYLRVYFFY